MAKYLDGFIIVVPKSKTDEYKKMAEGGRDLWIKHGALEYYECRGDDVIAHEMGGMRSLAFTDLAKAGPDEDVWFSFIVFESKEHRDEVNKKIVDDMNEQYKDQKDMSMPFDMERMAYGGFTVEVKA